MSIYNKIIFLGAPGAGKGTQAKILSEHLDLKHIASGELFRTEIRKGSNLGKESKYYIQNGLLVPDKLTNEIVLKTVKKHITNGFILDGFPRNLFQIFALESIVDISLERGVLVFFFKITKEHSRERLTARSLTQNRLDDNHNSVLKRIQVYQNETEPIVKYFKKQEVLFEINAFASMEKVSKDILNIVNAKMMSLKSDGV